MNKVHEKNKLEEKIQQLTKCSLLFWYRECIEQCFLSKAMKYFFTYPFSTCKSFAMVNHWSLLDLLEMGILKVFHRFHYDNQSMFLFFFSNQFLVKKFCGILMSEYVYNCTFIVNSKWMGKTY